MDEQTRSALQALRRHIANVGAMNHARLNGEMPVIDVDAWIAELADIEAALMPAASSRPPDGRVGPPVSAAPSAPGETATPDPRATILRRRTPLPPEVLADALTDRVQVSSERLLTATPVTRPAPPTEDQ